MIAIIPARSGSKGLPDKNIRELCGKPLIAHTILAAKDSNSIDEIIVSTDDPTIAKISEAYGAHVPFLRPKELATDDSPAIKTYLFTVQKLVNELSFAITDFAVLLPTSPLRNGADIDRAIQIFRQKNADSVISCCEAAHPPVWAKRIDEYGRLFDYFDTTISNKNRQEIPPAFMPNGAIYVFNYAFLERTSSYYSENTFAYVMPANRSFDIDTEFDFELVQLYMSSRNKE